MRAARRSRSLGRRLSNVVFMGMGEPFANEERVWAAVQRLHDDVGLSARSVTISTVGLVPGIRKLATRPLPVNLAVSLHAADDELRDELVPINRRYPLDALMAACADYLRARNRRLSFEWALIDGVNDRDVDADRLAGAVPPTPPASPRQPHPAQPDARLADRRQPPGAGAGLPRPPPEPGGQRHDPPQPWYRHRCRLWPARGRPPGHDPDAPTMRCCWAQPCPRVVHHAPTGRPRLR